MKSLLITSELFDIGGLETHIAGEINCLSEIGFCIHFATGASTCNKVLVKKAASVTTGLAMGSAITTADLIQTVESIRKIIRERGVECVHAHPFTSFVPSQIAAELEGVPFVLTLHGPSSLTDYYGTLYDFFLTSVILPKADMVVAVSQEIADLADPYVDDSRLCVLPNGVSEEFCGDGPIKGYTDKRWLLVSRLDSYKIVGIRDFIQKAVFAGLPGVIIVGDGDARCELESQLRIDGLSNYVEFFGATIDVPKMMKQAAGVAGMGRVVLEGLACSKPVVLVGYDGVKGVVSPDVFRAAAETNFSGRRMPNIDAKELSRQLSEVQSSDFELIHQLIKTEYSENLIWQKFARQICNLKSHGRSILADAYIKFYSEANLPAESYLYSREWFEQIRRLSHSIKHFNQSVVSNFSYHYFSSLNQAVAERDGKIASLNQALTQRETEIMNIKKSTSWRITAPLRFLKECIFKL